MIYTDDNETITADWVFANFASKGPQYSARERTDAPGLVWENRFERFTLFSQPIPQVKTRGQLRDLIRVLFSVELDGKIQAPSGTLEMEIALGLCVQREWQEHEVYTKGARFPWCNAECQIISEMDLGGFVDMTIEIASRNRLMAELRPGMKFMVTKISYGLHPDEPTVFTLCPTPSD